MFTPLFNSILQPFPILHLGLAPRPFNYKITGLGIAHHIMLLGQLNQSKYHWLGHIQQYKLVMTIAHYFIVCMLCASSRDRD